MISSVCIALFAVLLNANAAPPGPPRNFDGEGFEGPPGGPPGHPGHHGPHGPRGPHGPHGPHGPPPFIKECEEATNVTFADARECASNNSTEAPCTGEESCFFKCLLIKTGKMDENGDIIMPSDEEFFSEEIKTCLKDKDVAQNEDPCEKALNFHKCIMQNKPKHWKHRGPPRPPGPPGPIANQTVS